MQALTAAGVLEEETLGREKLFLNSKLLELLAHDGNEEPPQR